MTDPREIEGTPERAADRGRAEDLGFSMSKKPSLGDQNVVRKLVSDFSSEVVAVRKAYNQDKLSGEQAQQRIRDIARKYGDIVMGRSSAYDALPWNSPRQLGVRIKLVTAPVDGVEDPGEQLFVTVGTSLASIAAAMEADRLPDDDAERHTKDMLEDTANLILGLR